MATRTKGVEAQHGRVIVIYQLTTKTSNKDPSSRVSSARGGEPIADNDDAIAEEEESFALVDTDNEAPHQAKYLQPRVFGYRGGRTAI